MYFGDGASSTGDFHAGMNFAATLDVPTIFFCRNNGYAISTPNREQYRCDSIASRGRGYGMDSMKVDGNDILAVYNATKKGREIAVNEQRPVLIEAITYRMSHHSTSDDSTQYRAKEEINAWGKLDPISRFQLYLQRKGWWSGDQEKQAVTDINNQVLTALKTAEKKPKPALELLFTDVYSEMPQNLKAQQQSLLNNISLHPDAYHWNDGQG